MLRAGDRIGDYLVEGSITLHGAPRLISAGGMGAVYRCVHVHSGVAAALKTVTAPRESLLPAIRREIEALGRLRHPGVVRILGSGEFAGVPWYAMELLAGRSLAEVRDDLWASGPPRPEQLRAALTLVRRLCEPLAYLHGEGLVHGDFKPENVVCAGDGRPVLIDLGLLTAFAGQAGREAIDGRLHGAGSAAYMAPEQQGGGEVDARADLYALGCVLYELVCGRVPFEDERLGEVLRMHREDVPAAPSSLGAPRGFDDLLLRLLAKQPRDRIGHAEDVAARLVALGAEGGREKGPRARVHLFRPGLAGRGGDVEGLVGEIEGRFAAGRGGLAFVVGESGVGKTRLCVEVARRVQVGGATVLAGGCLLNVGGALQGLMRPLQAIADRCVAMGGEETARLLGEDGRVLARYQPGLVAVVGEGVEVQDEPLAVQARVAHALGAVFERLCADGPRLLLLDDLQWADALTLALLKKLEEDGALGRARLFVLATVRREEVGEEVGRVMALGRRIDLGRLDEDGVRGMIGDMLGLSAPGDALVRGVAAHTEGNPLFVAEYLRAAVREGLLVRDGRGRFRAVGEDLAGLGLPGSLHALIAGRLDGLGEELRRVANVAAVIGRVVDGKLVERVAGIEEAAVVRATGELVARQVLEESGEGLRFAHDKLREVAYERMDGEERARVHRGVAAALDAGSVEVAAHHWLCAGEAARAAPLLLAAARASRRACDNARAIESCRRVIGILEAPVEGLREALRSRWTLWVDPEDPGAGVDVIGEARRVAQRELGDALTTTGRHDEALAAFAAMLAGCEGAVARADALARMGAALFAKGELQAAAGRLEEALALLGERLPGTRVGEIVGIVGAAGLWIGRLVMRRPLIEVRARAIVGLRVRILNRLTYIRYSFSVVRAAASHLAALAAAERIATTSAAAETFAHHGPLFAGHLPDSARHHARRAVEVCAREGHLAMQMTAEFMAGMCFTFQGRWEEATRSFRGAIDLYPRVGDLLVLQTAHENLGYALLYRGAFAEALAESSRALELAVRAGDVRGTCNSSCHVALAHLRLGEVGRARRVAEEAAALLPGLAGHVLRCLVHTLLGRIALAEGNAGEARAALVRAVGIAEEHGLAQEEVVPAYTELLELQETDVGETRRLLARARRFGRRFPAHAGAWLRAEGVMLARAGRLAAARRRMGRAIVVLEDRGMDHELGRTFEVLARIDAGRREEALAQAERLYRACGAAADLRRVLRGDASVV